MGNSQLGNYWTINEGRCTTSYQPCTIFSSRPRIPRPCGERKRAQAFHSHSSSLGSMEVSRATRQGFKQPSAATTRRNPPSRCTGTQACAISGRLSQRRLELLCGYTTTGLMLNLTLWLRHHFNQNMIQILPPHHLYYARLQKHSCSNLLISIEIC